MNRPQPFHPSWLEPRSTPPMAAHSAAIDQFCANLLAGDNPLSGVGDEYNRTLCIEQAIEERN